MLESLPIIWDPPAIVFLVNPVESTPEVMSTVTSYVADGSFLVAAAAVATTGVPTVKAVDGAGATVQMANALLES